MVTSSFHMYTLSSKIDKLGSEIGARFARAYLEQQQVVLKLLTKSDHNIHIHTA